MAQVILFGGGDGGGLVITPNGIRRIPPFDPLLRGQLAALSKLTRASAFLPNADIRRQLAPVTAKLTFLVLAQVESLVGTIDSANGLVYDDPDGGFVCGSTGKPPIPVPPKGSLQNLLESGQFGSEELRFLESAIAKKADIFALFEDPQREAKRLQLPITAETTERIRLAHLSRAKLQDPVDKEIADFFQKTVLDGRYVHEWAAAPARVSDQLGFSVSKAALERISQISAVNQFLPPGSTAENPIAIAVVVGIVIMLVDRPAEQVIDESTAAKP